MYPKLEGRFPQVAGISFAFDPRQPPGKRVDPQLVRIGDEYLEPDQRYRMATKMYLYSGCDGYSVLRDAKVLVSFQIFYIYCRNTMLFFLQDLLQHLKCDFELMERTVPYVYS
jgi:2',3'-cyclic-nucleotide 2'-phosphodiesterase (5'-nucleotidase family)